MAFLILLYSLMAVGINSINTGAIPPPPPPMPIPINTTFYNAIDSSCTNATELLTKQKEIFANCQNFAEINQTMLLTKDNEQPILCLLYYNRIVSYCQSKPKQFEYPTLPDVISKNYALTDICKNIVEYSNASIKELTCYHLCTDFEDVKPECLWSHFYNNLIKNATLSSTTLASKPTKSIPIHNPQQLVAPAVKPGAGVISAEKPIQNNAQGGDPDTKANKLLAQAETGKGQLVPDDSKPIVVKDLKPDDVTEHKHDEEEEHKKPKADEQSADNKPPTNDQSSGIQQPVQDPNLLPSQIQPQPVKVDTQPPQQEVPVEVKPEDKPTETKEPIVKPVGNVHTDVIEAPASSKVVVDETKQKGNQPKLENGETDIDDGEGQHGVPDTDDYNGVAEEGLPEDISQDQTAQEAKQKISEKKPDTLQGNPVSTDNIDEIDGESYFMSYFMVVCVLVVLGYVGYHNRIKVMALLLEGKRNRRPYRGRRPNSANYHKLDSNLEEAISSNVTKNTNNVIY